MKEDIVIHKYVIDRIGQNDIEMPINAEILSVQVQMDKIVLWAMHTTLEKEVEPSTETRTILVYGTGQTFTIPTDYEVVYIETIQAYGGFVWHVFEGKRIKR